MSAACGDANVTEGTDVAESVVPLACPPGRPPLCGRARWARWSTGGYTGPPKPQDVSRQCSSPCASVVTSSAPSVRLSRCSGGDFLRVPDRRGSACRVWNQVSSVPYRLRSIEQITRFFEGLELVEPG